MPDDFKNDEQALRKALVETGVVTAAAFDECVAVRREVRAMGVEPEPLLGVLIQKGHLDPSKARELEAGASPHAADVVLEIPGYEILGTIGKGGMGTVFKGFQKSMARDVAIKVLFPETARIPGYVDRFFHEARMAAKVKHTNIVAAFDVGEVAGHYYLVMEYFPGRTLKEVIFEHEKLPVDKTIDIGMQMSRALENSHANRLVHRDIKPENIMINDEGVAKLCDMGLARETLPGDSGKRELAGTPLYISPEQARGKADVDIRSDIYSLGATLYHMMLGRPPYLGNDPRKILRAHMDEPLVPPAKRDPSIPKPVSDLVVRMMSKEPDKRHPNPTALLAHMQRIWESLSEPVKTGPTQKPMAAATQAKPPAEAAAKEAGSEGQKIRTKRRRISKSQGALWGVIVVGVIAAVALVAVLKGGGKPDSPKKTGDGESQPSRRDPQPRPPPDPMPVPSDQMKQVLPPSQNDAARQALAQAESHLAAHPEDFEGALDRLKEARSKAAGTAVEKSVENRIAEVEEMRALAREKGAGDSVARAAELVASGRPGLAVDLLAGWAQREGLSAGSKELTEKALNEASDALLSRWTVDKNSIQILSKGMDFDAAIRTAMSAVDPETGYGTFESILSESGDDVRSMAAGLAAAKADFMARAAAEEGAKFAKLYADVSGLLASGIIPGSQRQQPLPLAARVPSAVAYIGEVMHDPILGFASPKAAALKADISRAAGLLDAAFAGIKSLAGRGHKVTMKGQQAPRKILDVEESGGDQLVTLDSPRARVGLRSLLLEVCEADLLAILEAAAVTRGASPDDSLALAVFYVWCTPGAIPGSAESAAAHLDKAASSGLDVTLYRTALESRKRLMGDADVVEKIDAALSLARDADKKKAEAAYKALESLLAEYKDSPGLAQRRPEIDSAMADLRRRFPAAAAVHVPFLGNDLVFYDEPRRAFEASYDFSRQSELDDWVVRTHGDRPEPWFQIVLDRDLGREQQLSVRVGKLSFTGGGYLCWEPRLSGDVLFEIEFAALELPGILLFMAASDTGGYCYNTPMNWIELAAMGNQAGLKIPHTVSEGLSTFDLKWPQNVALLDGKGEILKLRQAYKLVLARTGDRVSAELFDSKSRLLAACEKRDSSRKEGRVGVALLKSGIMIEKAYVRGTFEERWFRSAEQGRKTGERGDMPGEPAR